MSSFRPGNVRSYLRQVAVVLAVVCAPAVAAAQQATITGRVTAAATGQPVAEARVFLVGTSAAIATNQDGRYTLRSAPGQYEVRVLRVGFQEQKKSIIVPATGSVTVDFSMAASVVKLTEVVTTATGQQRKVELGNSVQTLGDISQKVEQAPITNLSDLLVAKAPGVVVLPGNMTGSAPAVRIRGIKSISLGSEPIYVIDGVRMNAGSLGVGSGGTTVSLLNVLNPEEIADIEIVKGPSAATLYGTDAANGVIVITTKKGTAGPARYAWHAGIGSVQDRNNYPTQYSIWGHAPATPATPARCILVTIASGACVADSTSSYNLLADKEVSPITNGFSKLGGGQVSGGTDQVRYFVSGDYEAEQGPVTMPMYSQLYLQSLNEQVREEWMHPEYFRRNSFRANVNAAVSPKLDISVNAAYANSDQRLPQVDNNTFSYFYQGMNNPGFKPSIACQTTPVNCLGYTNKGGLGEVLGGYIQFSPANLFQYYGDQRVDRIITSATADWRPIAWLTNNATVGMDQVQRDFYQLCRVADCPASGTTRLGFANDTRAEDRNLSLKLISTGSWQVKSNMNAKTTAGIDYTNTETQSTSASGSTLPPGAVNAGAGAIQSANNALSRASKTLGYYAQEQFTLNDRMFLTLAARSDQNSAFGTKFQRVIYPKASLSWILSDESYFPKIAAINTFRLRGSYGASGVQPGSTTALQTFNSAVVNIATTPTASAGADSPGLLQAALGNPNLKPERSTEREFGFETRMFSNRVNFDYTYYNNKTQDALLDLPLAPSAGPSSLTVTRNFGSIRNSGHEVTVTTTIMDRRNFGWDITIGGSHNTNKVEDLGLDPVTGKPNPTVGTGSNRDSVGFPIRGIYYRPYTYADSNSNGIIEAKEVVVSKDFVYGGYSVPRDIVTIQNGFDLFSRKLHLSALLDYKGGFSLFNQTTSFYCANTSTCYDETHKDASLADQARNIAQRYVNPNVPVANQNTTTAGYYENGQFWRLREISATLTIPEALSARLAARDASLTFNARNLHVWTGYKGTDPESNYSTGNVQTDFSTTAPPSYFSVRLNLHY